MPPDNFWKTLVEAVPSRKLRRYEAANLAFEIAALYFTVQFTQHLKNEFLSSILMGAVILMGLACVLWACKQ